MPRLNDRAATNARPFATDQIVWDDQLAGFGLRIKPSGIRSWIVDYRDEAGRKVRATLGRFPVMGAATARREALKALGERKPSAKHDPQRITLGQLWAMYDRLHVARLKPRTRVDRRIIWNRHIKAALQSRPVTSVSEVDVNELLAKVWHMEGVRWHVRKVLVNLYRFGTQHKVVPPGVSPASQIKVPVYKSRLRFLTVEEWERYGAALAHVQATGRGVRSSCDAIRFICLSGFRKREALDLTAEMLNVSSLTVSLPDSKTGGQDRQISAEAVAFLQSIWPPAGGYFFPGRRIGTPLRNIDKTVNNVAIRAGIADRVTLHSLRHSFAETAIAHNVNLRVLQSLLGHKSLKATMVYSHVRDRMVAMGAATVGGAVARAMGLASAEPEPGPAILHDKG